MKRKISILSLAILLPFSVMSQDLLDLLKTEINFEKRALVAEGMDISSVESPDFWNIYTDFENEINSLGDRRINNIKKFYDNYEDMSDEVAGDIAKTYLSIKGDRIKIYKKYYKKFSSLIGDRRAVRLFQIMDQIQLLIDLQIASEQPLLE